MAVSQHLDLHLFQRLETPTTMPPGIRKHGIPRPSMAILQRIHGRGIGVVCDDLGTPVAFVGKWERESVAVIFHLKVERRGEPLARREQGEGVARYDFVDVGMEDEASGRDATE